MKVANAEVSIPTMEESIPDRVTVSGLMPRVPSQSHAHVNNATCPHIDLAVNVSSDRGLKMRRGPRKKNTKKKKKKK
jgi:hypothetical protein